MNEKIRFGTDGIRGKADQFPFTPEALVILGQAIAQWSFEKYETEKPRILLGHDTRESSPVIKKNLERGLSLFPVDIVDGGELPTPAILQLIQKSTPKEGEKKFDFGIVISASHNPYTDNGIKLFDANTGKLGQEDEKIIAKSFETIAQSQKQHLLPQGSTTKWEIAWRIYLDNLLEYFPEDFMKNLGPYGSHAFVIDGAHGAASSTATMAFSLLTEGVMIVCQGVEPDGKNINDGCGATNPEFLREHVLGNKADIGFAFDGDGDRVIAVNKYGEIKDGDDLIAILLQHPDFANEKKVVGTVMTNHGFEKYLTENGKELLRTKVGDKYVAAKMENENIMLGGEASGHIIVRNYLKSGDGLFVALKVMESIIANDNWEMKTFTKTPQILINVPIAQKKDLAQKPYTTIIDEHKIKLLDGRIIVRYSGTENLLRVMVEDKTHDSAVTIAQDLSYKLQRALRN